MSRIAPQSCFFCGVIGPLTDEHVLPHHWKREFPVTGGVDFISEGSKGVVEHSRKEQHTLYDSAVKRFCSSCNNGWMNTMDQKMKPLMLELAWGRSMDIPHEHVRPFMEWATKVAIVRTVADELQGGSAELQVRRKFFESRSSGPRVLVQYAYCPRQILISSNSWARVTSPGPDSVVGSFNVVSFGIGHLVMQIGVASSDRVAQRQLRETLWATRQFSNGAIQLLDQESDNYLAIDMDPDHISAVREPLSVRGLRPLTGGNPNFFLTN